ncbi:MAG: intermembrane phospholipid transport protein YdbH family protein [Woeseiaceae bacterium]
MRISKYILIAAGAAVCLAVVAWFLRDSLIQRISNPLLQDYGISVTDVSLDALATGDATIGYLELVHDKGTTIAIEDLSLPLGTTSTGSRKYSAKKVSVITSTRTDGEPLELAQLIGQFLSLPDNLGDSEVAVAEFNLPPYPTVHNLQWKLTDDEQELGATVAAVAMAATIRRIDATNHALVFSLPTGADPAPGHSIAANLRLYDQGVSLGGLSSIDLPSWEPIARLSGVVPQEVRVESGTAALRFDVEIPNDASVSPTLSAHLAPSSQLLLTYSEPPGEITSITVESADPVEIEATFPTVEWSLQLPQASLLVTYGEWQDVPVSVSKISCESGPACSMYTRIAMDAAELPIGKVGRFEFTSADKVLFTDDGVLVDIQSGAALIMTRSSFAETKVDKIEAQLVSAATLELVDAGWRISADALDTTITSMSVSDAGSVTTQLFLENVLISELDERPIAESGIYAPRSEASFSELSIALPGFKGDVLLQGADVTIDLNSIGIHQNGKIEARHNLDTGTGQLTVGDAAISFGTEKLSNRVSPWAYDRDLVAGTIWFDLGADWSRKNSDLEFDAQTSIAIADLAGYYVDTAFTDLSTQLDVKYHSATGLAAEPSTITVGLVEMGLPVENISAEYTLDPDTLSVGVMNLRMTAFGGVVRADPFSFRTDTDRNTLTLRAESVDLTELLSLNEFEAIEVSGSIGATLPLTIEGETVTIEDGTLTGDPAGGVIRYLPDSEPDESDASSIGIVTRTLSNFEFDTLTSDVNLTEEGDLNLKLQLTGRNPDLDENRPVILNLGVENNLPQMLKSLQAARAVEEILEKRLSK